jgi:hypothetical protein
MGVHYAWERTGNLQYMLIATYAAVKRREELGHSLFMDSFHSTFI